MATPNAHPTSTADYRKYPKGPNFLGIVVGSSIFILVALALAWLLLRGDARHLIPHGPSRTPNSQVQPLLPTSAPPSTVA